MSMFKEIAGLLVFLWLWPVIVIAEYQPKEMFTICWGDELNELKVHPAHLEGIISDSTEYDYYNGYGPSKAFIDDEGNMLINSPMFGQFKLFNNTGGLILDRSQFEAMSTLVQPDRFYIDTLCNIYLTYKPSVDFIPIYNYKGRLLDVLYPYGQSMILISDMKWSVYSELFILGENKNNYVVLKSDKFKSIDITWLQMQNGYLYNVVDCSEIRPHEIEFIKCLSPKRINPPVSAETTIVNLPGDSLFYMNLLPGGDGSNLYVHAAQYGSISELIYELDLDYNIVDKLIIPNSCKKYDFTIDPFIDRQGRIYEFRVVEDGLHVIRWTKQ